MAKPILGDIFIGNFPQTQGFGENPQMYAKFGLNGHNGLDFGTPNGTQIVSATDGKVIEVGWDQYGYGNYVKVWDPVQLCACIYAHLDHSVVAVNQEVVRGQLLGLSDNTGNSTGPHLHFGYCRTDENGVRTNKDNGYSGYINPNSYATWDIKDLTEPVEPQTHEESLQSELDKVRLDRDSHWNDLMDIKNKMGIGGDYSKTIILGELDKLIGYEDAIVQKDKQLSLNQQQMIDLQKELSAKQDALDRIQSEGRVLASKVQEQDKLINTLSDEIDVAQKQIEELKKSANPPALTGWRLTVYKWLIGG